MTVRPRRKPNYGSSVFINCPFDEEYRPLFRALVFSIEACAFAPRCALEVADAGETRAEKLVRLIRESRYGIHDISRTELNEEGLPRFNMPYEFGIFIGLKYSDAHRQKQKSALVLDREPFRYQRFLSDVAGQDIRSHGGDPKEIIRQVRHWLQSQVSRNILGATRLIEDHGRFLKDIPEFLAAIGKTPDDLDNYRDFHRLVCNWVDHTYNRPPQEFRNAEPH